MRKIRAWTFIVAFTAVFIAFTFTQKVGGSCADSTDIVTADGAVEMALFTEARYRYGNIPLDEADIREFVRANPACCYVVFLRGSIIDRILRKAPDVDVMLKYQANREKEKTSRGKFYEAVYTVDSCGKIRERNGGSSTS